MKIVIPVSPGELLDKITILELKRMHLRDPEQLGNVERELGYLEQIAADAIPDLLPQSASLREVNAKLWDIEDALRAMERDQDFGGLFVESARSVYRLNDKRSAIKKEINVLCGSEIIEEKSH